MSRFFVSIVLISSLAFSSHSFANETFCEYLFRGLWFNAMSRLEWDPTVDVNCSPHAVWFAATYNQWPLVNKMLAKRGDANHQVKATDEKFWEAELARLIKQDANIDLRVLRGQMTRTLLLYPMLSAQNGVAIVSRLFPALQPINWW